MTNTILQRARWIVALLWVFVLCSMAQAQTSVTTQHNDIGRTGQNTTETILTPANVNTATFGKLRTLPVDGQIYAQPLYLPSVSINGVAHAVVFVATEHDSVFAYDANTGTLLWQATMLDTAHGAAAGATSDPQTDTGCADIAELNGSHEYGITATPVIDPVTGTLYVESRTFENGYAVERLHALDITSGAEKLGGPTTIAASAGTLAFDPKWQNPRASLLLVNGYVFVAFGAFCDAGPYHGWLLGYNATTLKQSAVFVTTPTGTQSGIWMAGAGIAADVQNSVARLFPATGNGTYDATAPWGTNTMNYGDDVVRLTLSATGGLTVTDTFTPSNQAALSAADEDLGAGGTLLLPDQPGAHPHLLVQSGKSGTVYVIDRDTMGGNGATGGQPVQQVQLPAGLTGTGQYSNPAYWNGNLYYWPSTGKLARYTLTNGVMSSAPAEQSNESQPNYQGTSPSVSSNGTTNGIVWSVDWEQSPEILYAHDATNVSHLLYASYQNASRDAGGTANKFQVPTIADGMVFVGAENQVSVYGLLVPDFSVAAAATAVLVAPGATITDTLTVTQVLGFSAPVTFSASGLPAGVTATFAPGSAPNTYTVSFSAAATAALATTNLSIVATGGGLTHAIPISVTVGNYNVYGIGTAGTAVAGGGLDGSSYVYDAALLGASATYNGATFTFGPSSGLSAVSNTTIPLPAAGVSYATLSLVGAAVNGAQSAQSFVVTYTDGTTSTYTQSMSDWAVPGTNAGETAVVSMASRLNGTGAVSAQAVKLYGYSFALTQGKIPATLTLPANRNVVILGTALQTPLQSFTLSAAATSLSVTAGSSGTESISITGSGGFAGTVSFAATGLPTGATAAFAPASSTTGTVLTVATTAATAPGTYPVTVTGTSGSSSKTATFNLVVAAGPNFTLAPVAATLTVASGSSVTDTINVQSTGGFSGTVALAASGLPAGATATFAPATTTTSSVLTIATTTAAVPGTYSITLTGTSGSLVQSVALSLVIPVPPGFTLVPTATSLAATVGGTAATTINVAGQGGFAGTVAFAVSGLPAGATATFAPTASATGTVLTVATVATTPPGSYPLIVTGTSGTLTQTATVTLVVSAAPSYVQSPLFGFPTQGTAFVDPIAATQHLTGINVHAGWWLDFVQGVVASGTLPGHGGTGGSVFSATWPNNEYLVRMFGVISSTGVISQISFATNAGRILGPYGTNQAGGTLTNFDYTVPAGTEVVGLVGTADVNYVRSIGFVYGPPAPGFSIALGASSVTATRGGSATIQLTVNSVSGFAVPVTVSSPNLPAGVTLSTTANAAANSYTVTIAASATAALGVTPVEIDVSGGGVVQKATLSLSVSQVVVVAPAFNVYGIGTTGTAVAGGGLDGASYAYNSALLGASATYNGVTYAFGPSGGLSAIANATITLPAAGASYGTLSILGAAVNGAQAAQTFVVTYTDGTTSTFTQTLSDWAVQGTNAGETAVVSMASRLNGSGAVSPQAVKVYGYSFALTPGKIPATLKLPANRNVVVLGVGLKP